ncbi:hypothetical protein SAMN05444004_11910 [Jannaschia faecimaris]|uniref:Uncharacterized protein n=1 Tax=Jannaschia faecimaris TaxID=1244108 RepID=A0A1H3TR79_9RHOB|nr:hypothetical protein [Jannaschia faecimaris]SDZ52418.1 hypothetical protein SAMN05444004_11910 [Jannaschia faecimaris]
MRFVFPILLLLPACDPGLPPAKTAMSATAQAQPFPQLLPLDMLLAEGSRPSRAAAAQQELQGRAARLTGARITPPVTGGLEARGQRLRERAAQLRAVDI